MLNLYPSCGKSLTIRTILFSTNKYGKMLIPLYSGVSDKC